jgi:hypothetical protein
MTIKIVKKAVVNAKPSGFCSAFVDDFSPAKKV